jgi:tetratricopeptide (TPR) repeat protein
MAGSENLFDESMRLGHSAAWDLQWDKAIGFYRKALAESPDNPGALTSLGLALFETEQFKDALAVYHKASKVNPDDPIPIEKCAEIFERLGQLDDAVNQRQSVAQIYLQRKDAQKAIENWTHIARLKPDFLPARSRLALTYERTGRTRQAVYEYLTVASILQSSGKADRAAEAIQRALRLSPGDPEATKAMRTLQKGKELPTPAQPRGATAPLRMAKVREYLKPEMDVIDRDEGEMADPEVAAQRQALTILAGLLFDEPKEEGKEEKRKPRMAALTGRLGGKQAAVGQPQMYRYLGQAIDMQTRGHDEQAVKEYQRAVAAGLDHPAAHYNLGLLLKNVEEHDSARKHLISALGHPELDLGANLALGRLAHTQDDLSEAARYLLQALKLADGLSVDKSQFSQLNQFYDAIQASMAGGDEKELASIVDNTLRFLSGPDWLQRLREARRELESQRPGPEVVPIVDLIREGEGTDRVLKSMGVIEDLIAKDLYRAAMEETMLALDYAPTYLDLHMRMAEILIKSDQVEAGLGKLLTIAEAHQVRGEVPQAATTFTKILEVAPINIPARNRLIELLAQQERNTEALDQYLELAEIYRQMAEIDTARKALANALLLAQDASIGREYSIKILRQMGDIDLSRLDWRRALRVYEQIRTVNPGDEEARSHVIDLNLRLGQEDPAAQELDSYLAHLVETDRSHEALNLLEELAREHPGKQTLHARLAEAYRAAGRTADAIAQYDALGEIQLDAGETEEAIATIKTIIKLEPPDIEGYRELLQNLEDQG